jgi:hypothetical protein
MTDISVLIKETQKTRNKSLKYLTERELILKKIYDIIGITDTNNRFYSHEIEDEKVLELLEDILKYFSVSNWGIFKKKNYNNIHGLCLIKSVLKAMDVNLECIGGKKVLFNGIYKHTTIYIINN